MSKILRLKLKEFMLIHDTYKKQETVCQVFLSFIIDAKKDFEKNFEIEKGDRPLAAYLTKWILDELRKFVLVLTEVLFKTRNVAELSTSRMYARSRAIHAERDHDFPRQREGGHRLDGRAPAAASSILQGEDQGIPGVEAIIMNLVQICRRLVGCASNIFSAGGHVHKAK